MVDIDTKTKDVFKKYYEFYRDQHGLDYTNGDPENMTDVFDIFEKQYPDLATSEFVEDATKMLFIDVATVSDGDGEVAMRVAYELFHGYFNLKD